MKNRWLRFIVLYFAGLVIFLGQYKIVPVMGEISATFGVDTTSASLLSSSFMISGIILALPSAIILAKMGPKKLGILLLACLIVGNVMGALATSFAVLMIARIIEGIGFAFILLLSMTLIGTWWKPEELAVPTGIFLTCSMLAPFITLGFFGQIAQAWGLPWLWYVCAILGVVALILVAAFIKDPPKAPASEPQQEIKKQSIFIGFTNVRAIIVGGMVGVVIFVLQAYLTLYPSFFEFFYGLDTATANGLTSYAGLYALVVSIIAGIIIAKTGKLYPLTLIFFVGMVALSLTTFILPSMAAYHIHIIFMAIITGFLLTAIMSMGPIVAKSPEMIGYTVATVNFVYYLCAFLGAPATSAFVQASGGDWSSAAILLAILSVVGIVLTVVLMGINKKIAAQKQAE